MKKVIILIVCIGIVNLFFSCDSQPLEKEVESSNVDERIGSILDSSDTLFLEVLPPADTADSVMFYMTLYKNNHIAYLTEVIPPLSMDFPKKGLIFMLSQQRGNSDLIINIKNENNEQLFKSNCRSLVVNSFAKGHEQFISNKE